MEGAERIEHDRGVDRCFSEEIESHGRFFTRIPGASRLFMKVESNSYDFRISRYFGPSRFFMAFGPILRVRSHEAVFP